MTKIRWGYSKYKKAIWFYQSTETSRELCWSWSKEDLEDHYKRCTLTNLEYLEGLNLLKEKL
jgi:hypothetical protein